MKQRVVVTGMGVAAPNALGLENFHDAIRAGRSGIRFLEELREKKFGCCIGGVPPLDEELKAGHFTPLELRQIKAHNLLYGILAADEAWNDAGLERQADSPTDWESGCVFGAGLSGVRAIRDSVYFIDSGQVKRMGGTAATQIMPSGISALLGGRFGLGNWVMTNASACSTGTEAIRLAAEHIRAGRARRMLCGAAETDGPYLWGGFDAMRVLTRKFNDRPEQGSRPMSATASGFVPGGGAGALVLESLPSARERGARIYSEVAGGYSNAGGHRDGGSMTAPGREGIERCIRGALEHAGVSAGEIDLISGHLTATRGDPGEIHCWSRALDRRGERFPCINSLKSMIGHCLSAGGAIESVALILQLVHGFAHPSINCEDPHPGITSVIDPECIPGKAREIPGMKVAAKSSFGFGDVNSVLIFRAFDKS